jgi:hypothetical protein
MIEAGTILKLINVDRILCSELCLIGTEGYLTITVVGYLVLEMGTVSAREVAVGVRQENLQETAGI